MDTLTQGRVDIVIFPNGGWEFIGSIPANPEIPEEVYLPEVQKFVGQNQELPTPTKFTGYYGIAGDIFKMSWGEWKGAIPREEVETVKLTPEQVTEINEAEANAQ